MNATTTQLPTFVVAQELLDCGHPASAHGKNTTGYGTDREGKRYCYDCCAEIDRQDMIATGKATLYLSGWEVTDWTGHLRFQAGTVRKGRHNMAWVRYDVWFLGPDGHEWHGVQYGDNTQICHCRRTKTKMAS